MHDEVTNNTTCFEGKHIKLILCLHFVTKKNHHRDVPSFMCILGPNVLNILATRTSTWSLYKITKKEKQINWLSISANTEFYFTFNQPRKTNEKAVWLVPVSECLQISTIFDPVLLLTNRPTGSIFFHSLVRLTIFILEHILI